MEIKISSQKRNEIMDITSQVKEIVRKRFSDNAKACLIYSPHTTCGVLIQENYDSDVQKDILDYLSAIPKEGWRHMEGNSDSHIKSMIIGPSKMVPVKGNEILLGRWQGIALCEFDGPRERTVLIQEI